MIYSHRTPLGHPEWGTFCITKTTRKACGTKKAFADEQAHLSGRLPPVEWLPYLQRRGKFASAGYFRGLSALLILCPYRAEQATGLAGDYDSYKKYKRHKKAGFASFFMSAY